MSSAGEDQLFVLLKEYFPGKKIIKEYPLLNKLRVDFYIPDINAAFEYDGEQHDKYNSFFYKDKSDFYIAQNRDEQKKNICDKLGINLFRFNYKDKLTLGLFANRYEDLGPGDGVVKLGGEVYKVRTKLAKQIQRKTIAEAYKQSDNYKQQVKKVKEWRKMQYKKAKQRGKYEDNRSK